MQPGFSIPPLETKCLCCPYFFLIFWLNLGRSRQHQGLAAAMEKLWENSCVAKIALKRGVQLTTSERIAAEIKVNFFLISIMVSLSFY